MCNQALIERLEALAEECPREHLPAKIVLTSLSAALHDGSMHELAQHVMEYERNMLRQQQEERAHDATQRGDTSRRQLTTVELAQTMFERYTRRARPSAASAYDA
jgi:hypothetical protein